MAQLNSLIVNGGANFNGSVQGIGVISLVVASSPGFYKRNELPTPAKTTITVHPTWVNIGSKGYISDSDTAIDLSSASSWDSTTTDYTTAANRGGKDFYIYACQPTGALNTSPVFKLSANSTVPTGYTATTSRKIGGFHCLCADVGTISGHTLSGYVKGDILPLSVWDLLHRPVSDPEGMVWVAPINKWVDIYLPSYNNNKCSSIFGGTIIDGASTVKVNGSYSAELAGLANKQLISYDEFTVIAKGSNEETNIRGSTEPGTTGGHVDTAGRRMISNYGLEDCCGALWQWSSTVFEYTTGATWNTSNYNYNGYSWNTQSINNNGASSKSYTSDGLFGSCYGVLRRALVGGYWDVGVNCGSRCLGCNDLSSIGWSANSFRCCSFSVVGLGH